MMLPTRADRIACWWEDVTGAACFHMTAGTEARLQAAFTTVLAALSDEQAEAFFFRNIAVLCFEDARGAAFRFEALPGGYIWLDADAVRDDPDLDFLLAHEIAHTILGHADEQHGDADDDHERAADDLAKSWGFRRAPRRRMSEVERAAARWLRECETEDDARDE